MNSHPQAHWIKMWVEDKNSVQFLVMDGQWKNIESAAVFDYSWTSFRATPKPVYQYYLINELCGSSVVGYQRLPEHNVRVTFIDGKLTAVDLLELGDGK